MTPNNSPVPKPESEGTPDEFDFTKPVAETPRSKRRSLKAKKPAAALQPAQGAPASARELAREAPPLEAGETAPAFQPDPLQDDDAEINAAVKITEPAPAPAQPAPATARPAYASTAQPSKPLSSQPRPAATASPAQPATSPHGTRPATLYYSNGPRKEKEEPTPMKTIPTATVTTAPAPSATATPRPAASAATTRPAAAVDYRANVERQAREQKSVGSILAYVVYALLALFVVGAVLAGYGAYIVSVQLRQQSADVAQLDSHYGNVTRDIETKLAATTDSLNQTATQLAVAQAQVTKQEEVISKQQAAIAKLLSASQDLSASIRQERQARTEEISGFKTRLKNLEYQAPTPKK